MSARTRLACMRALVIGRSSGLGRAPAVELSRRGARGRGMPTDRAAAAILSGLGRRKAEVVPGWQAKGYAWLADWTPGLIDRWAAARWRADGLDPGQDGDGHAR